MYVNFIPNKGFKLIGTETGAFLADSINNDPLTTINSNWVEVPGTNLIVIEKHTVTLTRIGGGVTYVYKAIDTVIGQNYSAAFNVLSAELAPKMGVGDTSTNTSTERGTISQAVGNTGVYVLSFTATQTTHYVKLLNVLGAEPDGDVIFKNEVEIRHAELIGSEEGIELNQLNNAISDQTGEADSINGFLSIGLNGAGLNVFKTVSNLGYPEENTTENAVSPDGVTEADSTTGFTSVGLDGTGNNLFQTEKIEFPELHTYANAASDPNGNEANATAGWTTSFNGAITSVSDPVDVGTYAIRVQSDGVTAGSGGSMHFEDATFNLVDGRTYKISFRARHTPAGDDTYFGFGNTAHSISGQEIVTLDGTDLTYETYTAIFTKDGNSRYFVVRENNASNDGGVYIDNLSVTELGERNENLNAVAPNLVNEADSTTGFTSAGLDGTGGNIFQSVRTTAYPELVINGDFATDTNWTDNFNGSIGGTIEISSGTLNITQGSNSVWMGAYQTITTEIGKRYVFAVEKTAPGGASTSRISVDSSTVTENGDLGFLLNLNDGYAAIAFTATTTTTYLYIVNGGAASSAQSFDNATCQQSNEYHISADAAADPNGTEANATTGWSIQGSTTLTSVASPVATGSYAISAETNTTPGSLANAYLNFSVGENALTVGRRYLLTFDARHNGTGGDWRVAVSDAPNTTGTTEIIVDLTNADTTYQTYSLEFTRDVDHLYFTAVELAAGNDGGVYIDNVSVTEVQVNHGTYAIQAEANDTPTNGARIYTDLNASPYSLVYGKRYTINFDAKHVGVGGIWLLGVYVQNNGGAGTGIAQINSGNVQYNSYAKSFTHTPTSRYFIAIDNSGTDDGGIFLDNLSIKESNEYHIYRNAANIYDEADSTLGWGFAAGAVLSSVSSPVNNGAYAISVETNTTPTGAAGAYLDLNDSTINLELGREYTVSFYARHNGTGGIFPIALGVANNTLTTTIVSLDNSDTTYTLYSHTFTHSANTAFFLTREFSGTNDGGVYIDALSIVETQVNHGNFSIHAEANDTPTSLAKFYMNIETEFGLQDGRRYVMTLDAKHVGVGQQWLVNISNNYVSWTTTQTVATLTSSDNSFATYSESFIHSSDTDYLVCVESLTPNDGGIYLDNLSIKESNEYYLHSNAASDPSRESNTITGFVVSSSAVATSVTSPVNVGSYAISVESNTTPQIHGRISHDLNASPISLVDGKQYKLSVDVRHNGTGDQWKVMIGPNTTTNIGGVTIETYVNTDTTYATITYTWIHDTTDWRYLTFKEDSGSAHDGGLYVDNLSITEVQVNAGNYAFHAECNDTPTSLARCFVDMETEFGLETGKFYTVEVDAKHVGVGDDWIISIAPNNDSGSGFHVESNLISPIYNTYTANWIYAGEKYLVFVEGNASQNGGIYIDNLHVHESGEHHIYSNAAADPAGLEDNSTDGFVVANGALVTSVSSTVSVGTYAILVESNTTPTANARCLIDMESASINLQDGVTYTLSFDARHHGTGLDWKIEFLNSDFSTAVSILTLTNADTTYGAYAATWEHASTHRYLWLHEDNASNNGGVYFDNFSIRRSDPDHSATGLGLQKFGLLNKHVVNFNADLFSYSGFSAIDYLKQPYNPFLDYGTGDYFYKFWIKSTNASGSDIIFDRYSGSGNRINCWVASDGILNYFTTGGGTQNSGIVVNDNLWNMCIFGRTSGVNTITINNANVLTTPDVGSLTNTAAHLLIGINTVMTSFADATEIALFTTGGVALTNVQKQNLYNSEKYLFQRDAAYAQVSIGIDQDIAVRAINRSTEFDRKQNISLGGNTETLFNRQDNIWESTTTIIDFVDLKYYRLFFDSVVDGQTFTFDPYGVTAAPNDPKQVTYMDNKYAESREGQLDYFRVSFKVRE